MVRSTNRNRNRAEAARQPATSAPPETQEGTEDRPTSRAERRTTARDAESSAQTNGSAATSATASTLPARAEQRSLGAPATRNAFESYGQQMALTSIVGTLIKFNKGDWVDGDDQDLEEDTELVVNMDQLLTGWVKWVDQRPTEQIMGPVGEGYQPPRRG